MADTASTITLCSILLQINLPNDTRTNKKGGKEERKRGEGGRESLLNEHIAPEEPRKPDCNSGYCQATAMGASTHPRRSRPGGSLVEALAKPRRVHVDCTWISI